jgi:hypothetical protein
LPLNLRQLTTGKIIPAATAEWIGSMSGRDRPRFPMLRDHARRAAGVS